MVQRTYISKFNTIVSNNKNNTGLSPVCELCYGKNGVYSRGLCYFDHSKVQEMVNEGVYPDITKLKHTLRIKNAGSLDLTQLHCKSISRVSGGEMQRATSFDIIFFLIPQEWDRGKGFNYKKTYFNYDFYSATPRDTEFFLSEDGCNWYQARNGFNWDEEGVYSNSTLSIEYDKFSSQEGSNIIIGRQRFDIGNESIDIDITEVFNKFITGELQNYGIGFAFTPMLEIADSKYENYVGLLTDKTNTFFAPYVETRYLDSIEDDRANFALNKNNKLYLYCTIGSHLENLDNIPSCSIKNGDDEVIISDLEVKQQTKGVYYVELNLNSTDFEPDTMLYDVWDNINYQGASLDAVELDFTLKASSSWFAIGNAVTDEISFTPSLSGINEKEQIKRGDIRKLIIKARTSYTTKSYQVIDGLDIRLYIKDGTSEIDVVPWDKVEKTFNENFYVIDTNILLPQRYFVDVKINYGMNSTIHHDVLTFDIVDDINNKYA